MNLLTTRPHPVGRVAVLASHEAPFANAQLPARAQTNIGCGSSIVSFRGGPSTEERGRIRQMTKRDLFPISMPSLDARIR